MVGVRRRGFWGGLVYWTLVLGVWVLIAFGVFLAIFARNLPDTSNLMAVKHQPSITFLDRSGAVIAVRGSQISPPVDIDSLPKWVPAAFVAIEDKQFYHHFGVNPWGVVRSGVYNLTHHGGNLRGGSTITQQLARNLFLTPDQTFQRKGQELVLALWLETHFSKKQILSLYLNRVNFGGGATGIEAASQRYFNKPAQNLTVGEAALLAATMKGPSRYNPAANSERAAKRATLVLNAMVETGAITRAQRDEAFARPVHVSATLASQHAEYFVDWLDAQIRKQIGEPTEDLIVETTLDLPLQLQAEQAVRAGVQGATPLGVGQGALVALDGSGRIRAFVGGSNYAESQYDRAAESRRQAGSAFKPFVYLAAMEAGHTPDEAVVDEPITIDGWTPRNYTGKYLGPINLETALAQSVNTVAARLAHQVGTDKVAEAAHRLGISSHIQTDPSMALGAVEVSPLEMAQAYDAFANGGNAVTAFGLERVKTASGRLLIDHSAPPMASTVIAATPLSEMVRMMRQVLISGTGGRARVPGYDIAGKTGTTSDYRDAWFVGYTGGFTTAVWVGRDDNTPMRKVTGGAVPAEIWRTFMSGALPRLRAQPIPLGPPVADSATPDATPPDGLQPQSAGRPNACNSEPC